MGERKAGPPCRALAARRRRRPRCPSHPRGRPPRHSTATAEKGLRSGAPFSSARSARAAAPPGALGAGAARSVGRRPGVRRRRARPLVPHRRKRSPKAIWVRGGVARAVAERLLARVGAAPLRRAGRGGGGGGRDGAKAPRRDAEHRAAPRAGDGGGGRRARGGGGGGRRLADGVRQRARRPEPRAPRRAHRHARRDGRAPRRAARVHPPRPQGRPRAARPAGAVGGAARDARVARAARRRPHLRRPRRSRVGQRTKGAARRRAARAAPRARGDGGFGAAASRL